MTAFHYFFSAFLCFFGSFACDDDFLYVIENKEDENTAMICEQLYDLGMLQNAPLSPEAMTKFVARSNDIMMLLTK